MDSKLLVLTRCTNTKFIPTGLDTDADIEEEELLKAYSLISL